MLDVYYNALQGMSESDNVELLLLLRWNILMFHALIKILHICH